MSEKIQKYRFAAEILPHIGKKKLVLLTGARQTGKTTLSKKLYSGLRYINLDSPEDREILGAVPAASWGRDVGNAVIDEAQKAPLVFEKIKYAFDEESFSFAVILGSSQILLIKKVRESLAGRISIFELWPLMMSEIYRAADAKNIVRPMIDRLFFDEKFDDIFGAEPSILLGKDNVSRREAENYLLKWGGMPALLPEPEVDRRRWLKDYEYTYLERDLSDLARLDDLEPFRKFQKLAALRSGQLLSYSELARDAGVSVDTARRYLEYLKISYQTFLLQPFYQNITSTVIKTPKLYWVDIGILRHLCGLSTEISGPLYETLVVGEIIKWMKTMQRDGEVYFYRTRSGLELDLLLQTESGIVGMEIKSRSTVAMGDIGSMKDVAAGLGKKWRGGIVIYRGDEIKKLDPKNRIWAVPSHRLFI